MVFCNKEYTNSNFGIKDYKSSIDKDLDGKCDENCVDGIELSTDTNTVI